MFNLLLLDACVVCKEPATYGFEKRQNSPKKGNSNIGSLPKALYCERHAIKNTTNLAMVKCLCGNEARYVQESSSYCKFCKPSKAKRISYITCRLCNTKATRGINEYIPLYCDIHAPSFTVPTKEVACKQCGSRATYGKSTLHEPVSCYKCKRQGQVFISGRKLCYCLKRSTFGHYKAGRPLFCVSHAINGMCDYRIGLNDQ